MQRLILFISLFIPLFFHADITSLPNFEEGLGKGSTYIQTREDWENLNFFKALYEKNRNHSVKEHKIPKVIHFIWLGPNEFPQSSIAHIQQWQKKHPDWRFYFWTDLDRTLPCSGIEKRLIKDFHFERLGVLYDLAENFGEKAALLRYEILWQEGGLYADHDTRPLTSLDPFNEAYHFYCGLERLGPSFLSSSVFPSHHLIGAVPSHPIFKYTMEWLLENWHRLETFYPVNDIPSLVNRLQQRIFTALAEGIKKGIDQKGNRDIVFPPLGFSSPSEREARYVLHHHAQSWLPWSHSWETKILNRLGEIEKKERFLHTLLYVTMGVSLASVILVISRQKLKFLPFFLLLFCLSCEKKRGKNL